MNHYPLWKYLFIGAIIFICALYALPNLYGEDPAIQISPGYAQDIKMDEAIKQTAVTTLKEANIESIGVELTPDHLLFRFKDTNTQLQAYSLLKDTLPNDYVVAQNLAPATPSWLSAIGAQPMFLGLDLRGGVHFLMEVDMQAALKRDEEQLIHELKVLFRENKLRYRGLNRVLEVGGGVQVTFGDTETRDQARELVAQEHPVLNIIEEPIDDHGFLLAFKAEERQKNQQEALRQNIDTLRNRVNELGVAEPSIQQQGDNRIVVQLPGVQDTVHAKEILGATATLEFRLVAPPEDKLNARSYKKREGGTVMLKRNVIVTGDEIVYASQGIDQQTGQPATYVRLNSQGAKKMLRTTRTNLQKPMAVVFIEYKTDVETVNGKEVKNRYKVEEVVNVATIQGEFGKNFQITGLTSGEARNLALLLRAGALSAPIEIVEERTVGPSLGQKNIEQGKLSIMLGFLTVMIFMFIRYRTFGLIADVALSVNVILLIALLSLLQATLTLPGMAGIVLTLGMAVDANVLIFERIREEIANRNTPQASIHAGYEKAFWTIFDANITTLIAALMLFSFGTGPIKGFAITLSFGIITSMFTAIMVSRAIVNYSYGGKNLDRLVI